MLGDIATYVAREWRVIAQAPWTFAIALAALSALAYFAARWRFSARIEHLDERVKLRDDQIADYKRKLDGATPDEARARLDALEKLVGHLKPRELTASQRATLVAHLSRVTGKASLEYTYGDRPSQDYCNLLAAVFREAGWNVSDRHAVMTAWGTPNVGLRLMMPRDVPPTPMQEVVVASLQAAGVAFDYGDTMLPEGLDIRLLTGPRLA